MSDDVDLSEFLNMAKHKTCKVSFVLDSLKPAERKKLEAALAADSGRIPNTVIGRWIKDHAPDPGAMSPSTEGVSKHRKGTCSCA